MDAAPAKVGGLVLTPSAAMVTISSTLVFNPESDGRLLPASVCTWKSGDDAILASSGAGSYRALAIGTSEISVNCGDLQGSATVTVSPAANPGAITITHGGTYTGAWSSNDPAQPAVMVRTDEPVTLKNAMITGKGTLIQVFGTSAAHVTLENVTGIGIDPNVSGLSKGKFLDAQGVASIDIHNCTIKNVSFGIYLANSSPSFVSIQSNLGRDLDDRISDGHGGHLLNQRNLGHFILLNNVRTTKGAEIAWNEVTNTAGLSSTEDVINLFDSRGGDLNNPIYVHDNFLQGAFATGLTTGFTGSGFNVDGVSADPLSSSAFILAEKNTVVQTANVGFAISSGHDTIVRNNRVVSCGKDSNGVWTTFNGYAFMLWNYYNKPTFYNNQITGNTGGLILTRIAGQPTNSDFWMPSASADFNDTVTSNTLEHPCWVDGVVSQEPEAAEYTRWGQRVAGAKRQLGDQH